MGRSIEDRVAEVIKKVLSLNHDCSQLEPNSSLLCEPIGMNDVEFVYIVIELMEEFDIRFCTEDFDNYSFVSVEAITNAVKRRLNSKEKDRL